MKKNIKLMLLFIVCGIGYYMIPWLPTRNQSQLNRISAFYLQGNQEKALNMLNRYLKTYPDDDMAWLIRGNLHKKRDDVFQAEESYRKALALRPENVQALLELAGLRRAQKDYEGAMSCYEKALIFNPSHARTYADMTLICLKLDRDRQALEYALQAYALDKKDARIMANLALAYHYNDEIEKRDEMMRDAKRLGYENTDWLKLVFSGEVTIKDKAAVDDW